MDNNSGPEKLFQHLFNLLKKTVDGSDPYYFVYENLYVVPVPKIGGAFTAMEQLFDPTVLNTKLNGRTLDLTNEERTEQSSIQKMSFRYRSFSNGKLPSTLTASNRS